MDIFAELDVMQDRIFADDWSAFANHYASLCSTYNAGAASLIRNIDLSPYRDAISSSFALALSEAPKQPCAAIYLEYDLDNGWDSTFFICPQYHPLEAKDDDWACYFEHSIDAASQDDFASIYAQTDHFCNTNEATAITLYLIARTTEVINTVIHDHELPSVHICIGFHDQDPIHRLR
ncbi:hypothetical protein [Acaryochloris sp. CCMEE 5410]|uniref:hypothetical protein n=1 Tax=Acaryochloris sp. CCMEE 5410 TaxID=310037 RepID=UPI0002484504|nr:hypothetical protein [Acaryochloris sp. CCMEE 5410]KAI9134035.1 hypothetical protein ON05_012565 [Acaryochloris sp. CCMEE 5410]